MNILLKIYKQNLNNETNIFHCNDENSKLYYA